MDSMQLSENLKCGIANEVKAALENKNRTIEDSPYKEYLYELLENNDPFNKYYDKYDKKSVFAKLYLIVVAVVVIVSYVWAKMDPQIDFIRFTIEFIIFVTFAMGFISIFPMAIKKKKAMRQYIPTIKNNLTSLQNELENPTITKERRQYISSLHYICNFIYRRNKYTFDHYRC
ncbi:hypothetical protein ACFIJ5_14275 [Haloimpatiens sp. FM7330]|uniref:hypothetical protein n=1 Tax=Haloimpatiens sp. FM7330 TaxID=3298610 RepID=UPI00362DA415